VKKSGTSVSREQIAYEFIRPGSGAPDVQLVTLEVFSRDSDAAYEHGTVPDYSDHTGVSLRPRSKHSSISNSSATNVRLNRDHTTWAVREFADERIRLSRVFKRVDDHVVALACGGERPSDFSRCTRHQHHHAFAALVILTAR
jgi:hypothetical protein